MVKTVFCGDILYCQSLSLSYNIILACNYYVSLLMENRISRTWPEYRRSILLVDCGRGFDNIF